MPGRLPLILTLTMTGMALTGAALAGGGGPPLGGAMPPMPGGAKLADTIAPVARNVAYARTSPTQTLDVYLPTGSGPFPAVIAIHGGGFRFGDKAGWSAAVGTALLKAGYAVVAVNYRLSGEARFPAAPQDVKAAVRFIRANAARYRIDPARLGAYGESAGANLAALLGTTGDMAGLLDAPELGNAGVSSAVKAVADLYGPNDFAAIDRLLRAQGCPASVINHAGASSFESLYLGAALKDVPAKVVQANPATYVTPGDAAFLIQNGGKDCNVGGVQGQLLADALRSAGVSFETTFFPEAGHGGDDFESDANVQRIVMFFDKYVK
ncbi:alpha/beta hydrolase [Deinococcus soli (ex Cha et al. 2016)]|uniref:Acetyl esterase/lipase n=2 Tax=Deinococcus soli (ex Cha et al. 2016) TaxID=1309411 RepID=A0ACC6KNB4_9DEIO|nr:alpha/beta hydrolase [Deinococcus soli (ex Cha et al. 2016)]MDR6220842.1 acetyl esterase/lipase [Deinococcus soli (ex Cha et al. 2016)]MDR6330836.1 acetyl esterase/lipase [Deinococcus soli (ex Cha et al. 2016)]MDR6753941.1 acetyl esterase/lipase [Deinococcus soli (ex Cha et al. 2016)]